MAKYIVVIKEIHNQQVEIEADSPEEAIKLVEEGEGIERDSYYDSTLDSDMWSIA